ncbi:hypothetical protein DNL40_05910 [Xylanimonas oleitrophica]|uniref:Uncharacterized protein n=1 Tax=Xylanimonas oleitrophica TaxID=2607479 RepID=A0A2W5XU16_9MICO|nr:hypothetical protein [Xylanimonas oleitrophica]PZR53668.1 hypothetical protein DNL40_05910 [Xylanimonas oleitrophica]
MTEAASTARSPREPFAGVPAHALVRDVVAATALFVGLALPWGTDTRGTDQLGTVLATIVALLAVAAPYVRRAGLLPPTWFADERRTRLLGVAPYALVAVGHVLLDVLPGGGEGVGAGLGLGLAGAALAAEPRWRWTLPVAAGVVAAGAVLTPILAAVSGEEPGARLVAIVLTTALVLGILWMTVGRMERGDGAAGVLLLGLGVAVALSAALVSGSDASPWVESVHGTRFGLLLLPVLAACAVPRVVGEPVAEDAEPQRWAATAVHALFLGVVLGVYVAAVAVAAIVGGRVSVELVLRIVFGLLIAVVAYFAHRALSRDLASGHATAVGAAVVMVVLGTVIVIARAGVTTRTTTQDLLLTFGVPAIVLAVLLVPRSLHELRSRAVAAPAPAGAAWTGTAGVVAQPGSGPTAVSPAAGVAQQVPGQAAAAGSADPAPWDATAGRPDPGPQERTQVFGRPLVGPVAEAVAEPAPVAAPEAETSVRAAEPASASTSVLSPLTGAPVSSTQVMPPVVDVAGSGWTAEQALDPATPLADLARIVQEAPHLRPQVAANPSTYPALLDWLGALGDPAVDAALRTRR